MHPSVIRHSYVYFIFILERVILSSCFDEFGLLVCLQEGGISPRSENGGADSGGDSSGNESPAVDQEAACTPDPRGKQTHIQLSGEVAPRIK